MGAKAARKSANRRTGVQRPNRRKTVRRRGPYNAFSEARWYLDTPLKTLGRQQRRYWGNSSSVQGIEGYARDPDPQGLTISQERHWRAHEAGWYDMVRGGSGRHATDP